MPFLRLPTLFTLCLAVSACGTTPVQQSGGGGGGPANLAAMSPSLPSDGPRNLVNRTGTASPQATEQYALVVSGTRHLVQRGHSQAFGTVPFVVVAVEGSAYNNEKAGLKFPALAGATLGRYGWKYARITPENAREWSGDAGSPGEVFFLDSQGGMGDNSGRWVVIERTGGASAANEIRTEVSARTDLTTFEPSKVAGLNLGNVGRTWRVNAKWEDGRTASTSYPGAFLAYARPDGTRDFAVVGPDSPATIQARGYVYGFFITQGNDHPDGDLRLTLSRP